MTDVCLCMVCICVYLPVLQETKIQHIHTCMFEYASATKEEDLVLKLQLFAMTDVCLCMVCVCVHMPVLRERKI